jgi:parallel beta-helix repeat protein
MKKNGLTILCVAICTALSATNYYVSQIIGNDYGNNGLTSTTPFKTMQRGADFAYGGDTVFVMNGTYTNACAQCDVVDISHAGTSTAWIVFTPLSGHAPLVSFNGWNGIKMTSTAAYIEIKGFTVVGNNANLTLTQALNQPGGCNNPSGTVDPLYNGNGIAADAYASTGSHQHHLRVVGNTVYNCGGAGINMIQTDYVTIENNDVYNNSWYTLYGSSGISCWQNKNYDSGAGYHFIIRNNRSHGNQLFVPWKDGGCFIYDGNGIIIDDSRNTQNGSTNGIYTGKMLITNNLCYQNGGSGIHTYLSDNVDIINNTSYHNSISVSTMGEIFANSSGNIRILNNIIVPLPNEPANGNYMNTALTSDYNCYFNSSNITVLGAHDLKSDPQFVDEANANFRLKITSPCRDAGTATAAPTTDFVGYPRPQGAGYDLGAYELATIVPVELIKFSGYTEGSSCDARNSGKDLRNDGMTACRHVLNWTTASEIGTESFDIQQLMGENAFKTIGTIPAKGKAATYTYIYDKTLASFETTPTLTAYYRLKINDTDGKTAFSPIISLQNPFILRGPFVHPNPATDVLFIENAEREDATVVNVLGQVVMSLSKTVIGTPLSIQSLKSGIYFVKTGDKMVRFVKQ